jgi:hypothetical protein
MTRPGQPFLWTKGEERVVNATIKLRSAWNCGKKLARSCLGTSMTQRRWPIITTSISGIPPEMWEAFKTCAAGRDKTFREALEDAISRLEVAVTLGSPVIWPHIKKKDKDAPASHPVQMHDDVRQVMRGLVERTGYKQNIVVLAAMQRWMEKVE